MNETSKKRYLAELVVPEGSRLIGNQSIVETASSDLGLEIIEIFRNDKILDPSRVPVQIQKNDILLTKGSAEAMVGCLKNGQLLPVLGEEDIDFGTGDDLIIELVVPPMSGLLREPLTSTDLQNDPGVQILAIRTRRAYLSYRKIRHVRLKIGDILLVRCPREKLEKLRRDMDVIVLEDVHHALVNPEKANLAMAIFAGTVLAASLGLADIMVCAMAGVFLMSLTQCLSLKDAYRALEPEVLLLIIATIGLGAAMEKTGATTLYAGLFLDLFDRTSPGLVLAGMILLASISTHVLSNNATAVLLLPIAASTAQSLGVDAKPFIMGICFGASACFASPIGYQTNLLVYGPGGYRFSDYLKLGLPLNLLVIILATVLIPLAWPF